MYGIKARNCSLLDQLRYFLACRPCFTLDTNRRCLQTARSQRKVPDQHLMSQSDRNYEHWYSCRQRVVYVRWLAWTSDIFQRFSSSWSTLSCSCVPTSGYIEKSVFVPFSDLYFLQNLWDWWVFVIYAISCTVQIITATNHLPVSYIVCLTFTAPIFVHTMETVRIFQRLLLTIIVMMIILIEFAVAISMNSWIDFFWWYYWEGVYLNSLYFFRLLSFLFKNQEENMVYVLDTLNLQLYTN